MRKQKFLLFILLIFYFVFNAFPQASDDSLSPEQSKKTSHEVLVEMILSEKTDEEVLEFLKGLKISKEEINQKDENGYSPLYLAIDKGRASIIGLLIKKGADKNQISKITIRDKSGSKILRCSPVFYAAWKGDAASIKILMEKKANIEIESDFILANKKSKTYYRLLYPIDVAIYNQRHIDFKSVYEALSQNTLNKSHTHFVGSKTKYEEISTQTLLEKITEVK